MGTLLRGAGLTVFSVRLHLGPHLSKPEISKGLPKFLFASGNKRTTDDDWLVDRLPGICNDAGVCLSFYHDCSLRCRYCQLDYFSSNSLSSTNICLSCHHIEKSSAGGKRNVHLPAVERFNVAQAHWILAPLSRKSLTVHAHRHAITALKPRLCPLLMTRTWNGISLFIGQV